MHSHGSRTLSTGRAGIVVNPMPTYVYKFVKTGETIEVQQSFNEDTLTSVTHPTSGRKMAVKKVFTPVGVTFRGDGFYKTDSRSTSKKKSDAKTESKADSKADAKTATTSDASTSSSSETSTSTSKKTDAKASATP
jgi:predicted nucleic acid-binding Zn ribbon protein